MFDAVFVFLSVEKKLLLAQNFFVNIFSLIYTYPGIQWYNAMVHSTLLKLNSTDLNT